VRKGWEIKRLGEVCEVIAGQSPEGKFYNTYGKGLPFYQGKKDFGDKFIQAPTTWTTQTTKIAHEGDILMSVRAPVGPVNFATEEACIGRGLAAIRGRKESDRDFIFYQLLHLQPVIAGKEGAVFASINKSEIAALPIAFAPLPEQRRIVGVLDEAFAGLATAKANAEKNLQNARALFESHLNDVFTRRGPGWVEKRLGDVCEIERGGSPRPIKKFLTTDPKGINWIKIGDATASKKYIFRTEEKIIPEGAKRSRMVYEGDFILSNSMSFGRPYIMKTTGCIHDGWLVLRQPNADPDYLYQVLGSNLVFVQFDRLAAGSTVRNLNIGLAKSVNIPLPPLTEQKAITAHLDALSAETSRLAAIYTRKLTALEALKKSLLHDAFRGAL
jgi:type I restriction enzyme, S subunit